MFFSLNIFNNNIRVLLSAVALFTSFQTMALSHTAATSTASKDAVFSIRTLAPTLKVGDVIFIRAKAKPFREVAAATDSWTNHVGVVVDIDGAEVMIGESTFPFSRTTTLSRFIARSENKRVAVSRLSFPLTPEQAQKVAKAAQLRSGIFYDTGFDLHSQRQFCSRYVREVLQEATGVTVGEIETFGSLLQRHPQADLGFWKIWYFGQIPWQRQTVTPASLLRSPQLTPIFDVLAVNE